MPNGQEAAGVARAAMARGVLIRPMERRDAGQVLAIYQAGLDTGQASFETAAPEWEAFDAAKLPVHRHVAALRVHERAGSGSSACARGSAAITASGGTRCSSSGAAG